MCVCVSRGVRVGVNSPPRNFRRERGGGWSRVVLHAGAPCSNLQQCSGYGRCAVTPGWLCIFTLFLTLSTPLPVLHTVVAPQGLQLLKSTEESLLVSWEPSSEVDHYLLSYYPLGQELSGKQVQVPKEQHTYEIVGLQPATKYIVTLRNVKKEVSSSPQHLLATTGEEAVGCLRFPKRGPILMFSSIVPTNTLPVPRTLLSFGVEEHSGCKPGFWRKIPRLLSAPQSQ